MSGMACLPAELSNIPAPATGAPPAIGDANVKGTAVRYAREDHTHLSSVFRAIKPTEADGTVSWTYPTAFAAAPVVQLTVEAGTGQPYSVLITSNTATSGSAKVLRAQTLPSTIGLLTALQNFNIFGGTVAAGINVHVYAAKAS